MSLLVALARDENEAPASMAPQQLIHLSLRLDHVRLVQRSFSHDRFGVDPEDDSTLQPGFGVVHSHQQRQMSSQHDVGAQRELGPLPQPSALVRQTSPTAIATRIGIDVGWFR
jgi:hypothetical protein